MNLQISREAALHLIREKLQYLGNNNPSFADAHDYVRQHFAFGEYLEEFFKKQHELWVTTKHAASSLGGWAPSISADDFYETYECLVSVYRHILLGEEGRSSANI